jgi:hypothetical protein
MQPITKTQLQLRPTALTLAVSYPPNRLHLAVLHVKGALNHETYEEFIARAAALYAYGCRQLIIDLCQTRQIELSGLFALHSIARLYGGEPLLNPTIGWTALQREAQHVTRAMHEGVKLVYPSCTVACTIRQASFCWFLQIYNDLFAAMDSFVRCESN